MKATAQGPVKKPYRKPVLKVYGNIRTITNAVASNAVNSDGKAVFGKNLKTV